MTAEVVFNEIRQGRLKLDDELLISTNAWRTGGAPSRTSSMFAPINSRVRVEDLLRGVIIQSGNDACIALAEGIARSEDKFAALMTKRAREIGLTKSTFGNSTGLPNPRQLMTARELARLARHIIQHLSGLLQDLRRARIHLQQDPPVQPQSAAGAEHRRRRSQDRLHQGSRLRSRGLRRPERSAPDRRGQRAQEREGARRRGAQAARMGLQQFPGQYRCSPTVRSSPTPRSMAAARFRWWPGATSS